jgi:hypothetical protein
VLSCGGLSQPFICLGFEPIGPVCLINKGIYSSSVCKKWKDYIFTRQYSFKNTLKNSIKIHKNFIDPNSEKFKNNFKKFNIRLVSKSSMSLSKIYEQNSICIQVELYFKLLVHLGKEI